MLLAAATVAPLPEPVAPPLLMRVVPPIAPVPPPPPAPPPPKDYFKRAVPPRLLSRELISEADYPPYALQLGEHGNVSVALTIGEDGRVTSCFVEKSSGYPVLDATTCRLLRMRARFIPARDGAGNPVPSGFRQSVGWRLPPEPLWPRTQWTSRVALAVGADGTIKSCAVESRSPVTSLTSECADFQRFGPRYFTLVRGADATGDAVIVFQTDFVVGRSPPTLPAGARMVVRKASRFTIQADGTIASCAITEAAGSSDLAGPLCQMFDSPYVPAPAPTEGAIAMSIFLRQ